MASLIKRDKMYYAQYSIAGNVRRVSLRTSSYQAAKEKIRKIESSIACGSQLPLPTRTPIGEVVQGYIDFMATYKTLNGLKNDCWYLFQVFGPVCPSLSEQTRQRPRKVPKDIIATGCFEEITTALLSRYITNRVRERNLSPKSANRYREVLSHLFNWAMRQRGIRMPDSINPASFLERYKVPVRSIRFLDRGQISEQLDALADNLLMQTMVATLIFSGLRREELLWLREENVLMNVQQPRILVQEKSIDGEFWQPKTKVKRVIPISSTLRRYLGRYLETNRVDGWFFTNQNGRRWNVDWFSAQLKRRNAESGLPWTCLDFRHTFGSHLAMKGESLYKISTLMGNSPEIVRRHYATLMPESLMESVEF